MLKGNYCGECLYLNYTENQQQDYFRVYGYKPEHSCRKFKVTVKHENNHPEIVKYSKCDL